MISSNARSKQEICYLPELTGSKRSRSLYCSIKTRKPALKAGSRFLNRSELRSKMSPQRLTSTKRLLLSGHLLIRVTPGADLQATADPTEILGGCGRGIAAADYTLIHRGRTIRLQGQFCFPEDLFVDHHRFIKRFI